MLFEFGGSGDGNGTATALFGIVWATRSLTSSVFHPLDNSQRMRVVSFLYLFMHYSCDVDNISLPTTGQ